MSELEQKIIDMKRKLYLAIGGRRYFDYNDSVFSKERYTTLDGLDVEIYIREAKQ